MKVDRLVSMIMILLNKGRVSAQELAAMFEVSTRTIYRDIDAINMAGIPIRAISGVGGGIEIMPDYKMDNKIFSTDDLSAILMGLSNLSNVMPDTELRNSLAKVKSFIPAEQAKAIELRANQICIDFSRWSGNGNTKPYLEQFKTALQANCLLTFHYIGHHGKETFRTIEPYQLVLKNSQWYVQGYCLTKEDFRLFRLSRILDLKRLPDTFVPRAFQKPILDFDEFLQTMQTTITLRIHQSILDRVLEVCSYEHFTPDGDAHYLVSFPFVENAYHYDMLLSFGPACECLAPPHIREALKQRIHDVMMLYET